MYDLPFNLEDINRKNDQFLVVLQNFDEELTSDLASLSWDIYYSVKLLKECGRLIADVNLSTFIEVRSGFSLLTL